MRQTSFLGLIESVKVRRWGEDCLTWKMESGPFGKVKVSIQINVDSTQGASLFPVEAIWRWEVPPGGSFFAWTA